MNWFYIAAAMLVFALGVGALMGMVYGDSHAFVFGVLVALGIQVMVGLLFVLLYLGLRGLET